MEAPQREEQGTSSLRDSRSASSTQASTDAQSPSERVRTACAYGNYEQLTEVAEESPELLSAPDEMGYFPLQWAALNNRVGIIAYLIDKGVNINRWVAWALLYWFLHHGTPWRRTSGSP